MSLILFSFFCCCIGFRLSARRLPNIEHKYISSLKSKPPPRSQEAKNNTQSRNTRRPAESNSYSRFTMSEIEEGKATFNHIVACHCGNISGQFRCTADHIIAWECNCTDCGMRKNIHLVIPQEDLHIDGGRDYFDDNTILYVWGTKAARRRFCKTCGILPWYTPRSNPDGVAITLACVKFDTTNDPLSVVVKTYDGLNWEKSHKKSGIAGESKKKQQIV